MKNGKKIILMRNFSCLFVWNIAELAIVPTPCRVQTMKSSDLET